MLGLTFALPAVALAQNNNKPKEEKAREYVLSYTMVVVLFGAAMFAICRPSPRKPKEVEE